MGQGKGREEAVVHATARRRIAREPIVDCVVAGANPLVDQHRQVLGHSVPEIRAEHAHVEAATVPHANYSLGSHLIGEPQARSNRLPGVVDVSVQSIGSVAGDADNAFYGIGKAAVSFGIDPLREVDLPAQAIVQRQLRSDTVRVLPVEKPSLLPFRGIQARADETLHIMHIAQQEAAEPRTTYSTRS